MILELAKKSTLFKSFTDSEIKEILESEDCNVLEVEKNAYVFNQGDNPTHMYILLSGAVQVEKIDINGKRSIVNIFNEPGTVFAEVYLYLANHPYDYGCLSRKSSKILAIKKEFFQGESIVQRRIVQNMLEILSSKAFYLNQKLLIISSFTLKQKIANYLLQRCKSDSEIELDYNREELADYMGTTRPSLSRELSSMEKQGLISLKKASIEIRDMESLRDLV